MDEVMHAFHSVLEEIGASYPDFHFMVERDLVWTVQTRLSRYFQYNDMPYRVLNDFPIERGARRSNSVDLAVIGIHDSTRGILEWNMPPVELAAEFKFEPSNRRTEELCTHKCPVVYWNEVLIDIDRIGRYVETGRAKRAIAVFVDELSYHRKAGHSLDASFQREFGDDNPTWGARDDDLTIHQISWGSYGTPELDVSVFISERTARWSDMRR